MQVYLNEVTGIADAIVSMFMSKRSWSREFEVDIRRICHKVLDWTGRVKDNVEGHVSADELLQFNQWMDTLVKWGWTHITMLRFIDMSITVEGLHRAGQDDWDAHAPRFNNRIIRTSTRLATFKYEMSDWYQDKILPTDIALESLGITTPNEIEKDGLVYIKAVNGYVRKDLIEDADVKRGLYMLSIPSNFIFKVNLAEWAHVYKERNINGSANPEVKQCCESISDQIENFHSQFSRTFFMKVKN